MNLYRVYFQNGWSTMQLADTSIQAETKAIDSYTCWYSDNPEISHTVLIAENI